MCFAESSSRMGDSLGSPRVAPLSLFLKIRFLISRRRSPPTPLFSICGALRFRPHPRFGFSRPGARDGPWGPADHGGLNFRSVSPGKTHSMPAESSRRVLRRGWHRNAGSTSRRPKKAVVALFRPRSLSSRVAFIIVGRGNLAGAIIPALMHRIPSELRS